MLQSFEKYWHADQPGIRLELDLRDPERGRRQLLAGAGAIASEFILVAIVVMLPGGPPPRELSRPDLELDLSRATPLVAPRLEEFRLTQKEPSTGKPATEVSLAQLLPQPAIIPSPSPGASGASRSILPPRSIPSPRNIEPPKVEIGQQGVANLPAGPVPQIVPQENPRLALENLRSADIQPPGQPRLEPPRATLDEAARAASRDGSRGVIVGDVPGEGQGGVGELLRQTPSPNRPGSALELLSDPQGIDFKPYLVQVLAAVRRNWSAVMPESARFGQRGRVTIQFSIEKMGRVPKLVIAVPSGVTALDRAAVAGISASTPFPPLPTGFRGVEIRLQLVFSYNMPR